MNALLVRVGADLSVGGNSWNGPVNSHTRSFAYVAIPETHEVHAGMERPYGALAATLSTFGVELPPHLRGRHMHLDPDFAHLTYGDTRHKAKQLSQTLRPGDMIVFYAALRDTLSSRRLIYAIIGVIVVNSLLLASRIASQDRDSNAHCRRILPGNDDVIVQGRVKVSGRLRECLPIGEYRAGAYRVRRPLLEEWGGLSVTDGYLQRSARFPSFSDPQRFFHWFEKQKPQLLQANN